ncbi:MAG TPA: AI-2E family transporter [Chthonomonadales bacterium]|nr:AI-2E family transporter [Chthonomonadales bacterium]
MQWYAVAVVAVAAYTGAILCLADLARRDVSPWLKVAWVAIVLAFPIVGPIAYGLVGNGVLALTAWRRAAGSVAFVALAALVLWFVRDIVTPFLIAFFLAALLDPAVRKLQRRGVSRGRAVASIFLLTFLALALAGWGVGPRALGQMRDFANNVGTYASSLSEAADRFHAAHERAFRGLGLRERPSAMLTDGSGPVATAVQQVLDNLKNAILGFASQVIWLVIIPLALFYFLLEYPLLYNRVIAFVPDEGRHHVERISRDIVDVFSDYIRSLAIVCVLYGVAFMGLFAVLGLRYALFLGSAAGVLYAVPYVGPAITLVGSLLIAVTMEKPIGAVALVAVSGAALHVLFDYVVTPRVVGGSVGLHPVVNIFALMAGATLFGVWGMLLAVPVAASIRRVLLHFYPRLGRGDPESPPAADSLAPAGASP